jgi:hypothetical protein
MNCVLLSTNIVKYEVFFLFIIVLFRNHFFMLKTTTLDSKIRTFVIKKLIRVKRVLNRFFENIKLSNFTLIILKL